MDTPGIPNLDAMTDVELMQVDNTLLDLRYYIELRLVSMRFRLDGNIDRAVHNETMADRVFKALPEWARW